MKKLLGGIGLVITFGVCFVVFSSSKTPTPDTEPAVGLTPGLATASPPAATPESDTANVKVETEETAPIKKCVALSGAVIVSDNGTKVTYKRKCERCGKVLFGIGIADVYRKVTTQFRCPKCKQAQKVVLERY